MEASSEVECEEEKRTKRAPFSPLCCVFTWPSAAPCCFQVAPAARRRGLGQRLGVACEEIAAGCVERETNKNKKRAWRCAAARREGESARARRLLWKLASSSSSSSPPHFSCVQRWGFSELALTVDNANASAQQLYAKTGYQVRP
jgi:ribosomal protein S18 acetylase RimI-like enzyme